MQSTYDIYCARNTQGPWKPWRSYRKVQKCFISVVSNDPLQAGERFDKVAQEYSEDKAKGEALAILENDSKRMQLAAHWDGKLEVPWLGLSKKSPLLWNLQP